MLRGERDRGRLGDEDGDMSTSSDSPLGDSNGEGDRWPWCSMVRWCPACIGKGNIPSLSDPGDSGGEEAIMVKSESRYVSART